MDIKKDPFITPGMVIIFLAAGLACCLTGWPGILAGIGLCGMAGLIWWKIKTSK